MLLYIVLHVSASDSNKYYYIIIIIIHIFGIFNARKGVDTSF